MDRQRGFTLIEMLVVLGIIALTLGVSMPLLTAGSAATSAESAAEQIAAGLRATRAMAVGYGRATDFTIDVARGLAGNGDQLRRIAADDVVRLTLYTADGAVTGANSGAIRFYPDGGSTGGGVVVTSGARVYVVAVDWLGGGVSVSRRETDGAR